ncbi:hypothetical protein S58_61000 [Bradyrhizobium oligotrophicum S58]|uniref:Uncharacterized protein n=1 Tax=Bradyrhizobium oligotrophicum S58 TaxID=1245469 RepID=M4ZZY6_9BRAD|nr:hypothetical protein S58_61000 [Bradyrhizobium oligotrophicum S58]
MELASVGFTLGPISVTGTGVAGTGAAVVIAIAVIVWLVKVGPSRQI